MRRDINMAAIAIRDHLVNLAIINELPMDMNDLNWNDLAEIVEGNLREEADSQEPKQNNPLDQTVSHNLFSGTPLRKMMSGSDILDTYPEFFYTERTGENECAFCGRNGAIIHSVIGKVADLKNCFTDIGMVIEKVMIDGRLTDIKVVSVLLNIKRSTINEYNQNAR